MTKLPTDIRFNLMFPRKILLTTGAPAPEPLGPGRYVARLIPPASAKLGYEIYPADAHGEPIGGYVCKADVKRRWPPFPWVSITGIS